MLDDAIRRDARRYIDHQTLLNEVLRFRADVFVDGVLSLQDPLLRLLVPTGVLEGELATEHEGQDDPTRPYVGWFAVVTLVPQHLGGLVVERTRDGGEHGGVVAEGILSDVSRETKVADLEPVVPREQKVLRLEITVHYALRVAVAHTADELLVVSPCRRLRKTVHCYDLVKKFAVRRKLHDVEAEVVFADIDDLLEGDDVGVVQLGNEPRLSVHVLQNVLLSHHPHVHNLRRELLTGALAGGHLHDSKPTLPQGLPNDIPALVSNNIFRYPAFGRHFGLVGLQDADHECCLSVRSCDRVGV
eukprot:Sspe_Gene.54827::Locus_30210_Transcript_1_1_Confidence_1.000_Length_2140::g.54827::m.54827